MTLNVNDHRIIDGFWNSFGLFRVLEGFPGLTIVNLCFNPFIDSLSQLSIHLGHFLTADIL